jgi:hypothetical protein
MEYSGSMTRRSSTAALTILMACVVATGATLAAIPQDSALRAERVVAFTMGKATPLNAKVGPVSIQSVEFTDRGRGSGGSIPVITRPAPSETSTTLRAHFLAENPSADEWEVTFTVEFLDKSGKLIDRAVKKSKWEGRAKPFDFDHPILAYVVPAIAEVRITLEGRLD